MLYYISNSKHTYTIIRNIVNLKPYYMSCKTKVSQ